VDLATLSKLPEPRQVPELNASFDLKDAPTGWHPVPGYPLWQVVPDVTYPWNPEVVKAMRRIDPSIVPLWVTWAYKPPKDDANKDIFVTGRHAVGWHLPQYDSQDFHVLMPTGPIDGLTFKRPNRLWKIYHVASETEERIGGFVPWSWWMYYNLREEFREMGAPTIKEYIADKKAVMAVRKAAREAEHDYINAQMAPFINERLDRVPAHVWQMWQQGGYKTAKPERTTLSMANQRGLPPLGR
jgi:hypothetical protein